MGVKAKASVNTGTIVWLFYSLYHLMDIWEGFRSLRQILGIDYEDLRILTVITSTIVPVLLFTATVVFAISLIKNNQKLITMSSLALFVLYLLNLFLCAPNNIFWIKVWGSTGRHKLYVIQYSLKIISDIFCALYYLVVFKDRQVLNNGILYNPKKLVIIVSAYTLCGMLAELISKTELSSNAVTIVLGSLTLLFPYTLMAIFAFYGATKVTDNPKKACIEIAIIYAVFVIVSMGFSGRCNHKNCREYGPFPCMGKNDTCENKTYCAYDFYCDECD